MKTLQLEKYNIHVVTLPLPFDLDHVNCYVAVDRNGMWKIIDCGVNTEQNHAAWDQRISDFGLDWKRLQAIYVTHFHPDHYGAAGWLQEKSGAPVYMLPSGLEEVEILFNNRKHFLGELADYYQRNGVPEPLTQEMMGTLSKTGSLIHSQARLSPVEAGTRINLGGYEYEVIWTPGHAEGHCCFYGRENGILFAGDQLLAHISTNISLWPDGNPNPLAVYLESLQQLRKLPINIVLPAHGQPFTGAAERIDELCAHHRERLDLTKATAGNGSSAYEVCREIFGDQLNVYDMRFALAETMAHLVYLEQKSILATRLEGDRLLFYQPA